MLIKPLKNLLFIALLLVFCSPDLYAQNASVTVNQDPEITKLLSLKKEVDRKEKYYKIQIYNGSYSGAENAQVNFRKFFSGWPVSKEFETPNYKIWVGNFKTRLEADRALLRVKKKFANAFILKPKEKK